MIALVFLLVLTLQLSDAQFLCKAREYRPPVAHNNSRNPSLPLQYYMNKDPSGQPSDAALTDPQGGIIRQYFRGFGEIPNICESTHPEFFLGLCYHKCPDNFTGIGPVCWENCPAPYENVGLTCYLSLADWRLRDSCARDIGKLPTICRTGYEPSNDEIDIFLCYPKCRDGYMGVGPVCYLIQ